MSAHTINLFKKLKGLAVMENQESIAELLDQANKHYTRAMAMFFISGLLLGTGITYFVLN